MKKTLLLIFSAFSSAIFAQQLQNNQGWCLTHENHLQLLATDPSYVKNQEELEKFTQTFQSEYLAKKQGGSQDITTSTVKIIPVVFHVIHVLGNENISDAQLKSTIDVLNQDFRRLNADTNKTPAPFKSLGADCEIEFRLAQKDPNGNCTSGINRIFSPMTLNARDNVKALICWPSNKYLNIWVVKSIENTSGAPGSVIGFSQFPGGSAATDGVVLRSDFTGNIGTAAGTGAGRTATHEVGHWLNLRHIWGDDQGACTGTDLVGDTPNQADMTFSICPAFPLTDACTPSGNGILFSDYMDYTTGNCQNIFTVGQAARMNATLNSSISGRNNLWAPFNITTTGALDAPQLCGTDFTVNKKMPCVGTPVTFTPSAWNATATSWKWDFDNNGTVDDTTQNPTFTYTAPGVYSVNLTVGDGTTTKSVTKNSYMIILGASFLTATPFSESFENTGFPYADWYTNSASLNAERWDRVTTAGYTGSASLKLDNFSQSGDFDELITPIINMMYVTSPTMTFRIAYQRRNASDTLDGLKVYTSTNCGGTWTQRYSKTFTTLPTVATTSATAFTPASATEWRLDNVNINNITGQPNVRFKFEFFGNGSGNNIYLDDINITGTPNGMSEELENEFNLNVSPNPMNEQTVVSFSIPDNSEVAIGVYDLIGKEVISLAKTEGLSAGSYSFPLNKGTMTNGLYFIKLNVNGHSVIRKIVIQ